MQPLRTLAMPMIPSLQQVLLLLGPLLIMMIFMAAPAYAQTNNLALDEMLAKFVKNIHYPMLGTIYTGSYVFGAYLLMKGLLKCIKYSDEGSKGQQKFSGLWGTLLVGALLIATPSTMNSVAGTLYGDEALSNWGSSATNVMGYAQDSSIDEVMKQKLNRTYWVVMAFVQILGLISFVRGLSILRSVTDGNTQVTSMAGITHLTAGAIAWNLSEFVQVVFNTVGYNMQI